VPSFAVAQQLPRRRAGALAILKGYAAIDDGPSIAFRALHPAIDKDFELSSTT
jgi:hypothetical protein